MSEPLFSPFGPLAVMMICIIYALQGKFYLVIEELSQLFRSLVPIQLWCKYIMGDDPSSSYFLGGILIILYSLCKVRGCLVSKLCTRQQNP